MIRQFSVCNDTFGDCCCGIFITLVNTSEMRSSFVEQLFKNLPSTTAIHFGGGAIAIVCGAIH